MKRCSPKLSYFFGLGSPRFLIDYFLIKKCVYHIGVSIQVIISVIVCRKHLLWLLVNNTHIYFYRILKTRVDYTLHERFIASMRNVAEFDGKVFGQTRILKGIVSILIKQLTHIFVKTHSGLSSTSWYKFLCVEMFQHFATNQLLWTK